MISKKEFFAKIDVDNWKNQEGRKKNSFWASDCLRPSCDIYWKWIDEPETNPMKPQTVFALDVRKQYEVALVRRLENMGELVKLDDEQRIADLGLTVKNDQFRIEMEREFVPITGYMDAVHVSGIPVEVKTHYIPGVDKKLDTGHPPSEHYCHQLAVYMDYMGVDKGILAQGNIISGDIWFMEMEHLGDLVFKIRDYVFDLEIEYKRWRRIMENNIHQRREPDLQYFYRPELTKELLKLYPEDKIKKAIKGDRVLSDHKWRYQYSSYKDKVIEKEAQMKGVSVDDLCRYTPVEIQYMMDFLGVEWKDTKRGMQLYKKKG